MVTIDNETYLVKEYNHYKTQNVKTQIVLATSLRKDNYHIIRLKHKDFGATKKWNTYTVSRDGNIFQHYDSKYHSDFLGIKEADKKLVSIVLENMGYLVRRPDGKYVNWANEVCDEQFVVEKKWMNYMYWEAIPEVQLKSLVELCLKICDEHNIPKVCVDFDTYHKDIINFKGIVFKSNYFQNAVGINPLFNIERFNRMLVDGFSRVGLSQ